MSMFSQHFLISKDGKYWSGGDPNTEAGWTDYLNAVRFHTRSSAEALTRRGILVGTGCQIEEDE